MSCAILLLLCSVLYAAGPQLNPQEIQADKGGSILLGGRVDFNEQMVADLYKGLTWLGTYHHGFECASPYEERLEFHQGNGSFSLRNLGEGDSGAYSYTVFQIINGKNNKIQMNFQVTVTERKAVTEQPSGTSTTDQRSVTSTNSASTNSANTSTNSTRTSRTFLSDFTVQVMGQVCVWLCCVSLLHPLLILICTFIRCLPRGEQLPTCCNELMEISGSLSLSCVVFSAVFWLFYDNGKGATMTWCLSVIALILIGLNASPVVKWCTTPYGSGSRLPFCSVLGTSSQSPLVAQFRGYFSLLLVSLFSLCTILGFYLT
ncbi:hypothetical protein XENTR_v10000224 [Xenopus tropicalis]|uniref:Uncharacterized protein LOC101733807 n=1 Tax=Xenopus tropicalis TaxID=8364 RepID=A0A8J0T0I0_XENTR|nr:uncharacterized protein LOC101733807 [Xenopus tropicalis]KAE8628791.1 hypothetical protein XENTR_v10000224 [Xenopus tropicalis]